MTYAGEVVDGQTVQAIVGTAEWAVENLGGEWHDSENKIPVPGIWDAEHGFRPLQPSPNCWWEDGQWVCSPEFESVDDSV